MQPKLSVIVPIYNTEKYLRKCIESIINQTYTNLEIILIDDGSTDNSLNICTAIAQKDSRVKVIKNTHNGVVVTRNIGIEMASGKYITFVDADDYIAEDRYINMMSQIQDCDLVQALYTINFVGDIDTEKLVSEEQDILKMPAESIKSGIYQGDFLTDFIVNSYQNNIYDEYNPYLWTKIFKSDKLKSVYRDIDETIDFAEDGILCRRYLLECKKVKVIEDYGYFYSRDMIVNKYSSERIIRNMLKILNCEKKFLYGKDKRLQIALEKMCGLKIRNVVSHWGDEVGIYYPYYGRLSGKKVILYGAGNVGKVYYYNIKHDEECELVAWVDKNFEQLRKQLIPIDDMSCLFNKEYDYIVVAVFDKIIYEQIKVELVGQGIDEEKILWNPTRYE